MSVELVAEAVAPAAPAASVTARRATGEQALVASGQLLAGAGNLAFAFVMARLLAPAAFSQLASFLALYALVSLPATSLSAAGALVPDAGRLDRRLALLGGGLGVATAAAGPWLGPVLHLPVGAVVALGATGPIIGPLGLRRGQLYGRRRHGRLVLSLLAEPALRLGAGVGLGVAVGVVGGAAGVVLGAYAATELARRRRGPGRPAVGPAPGAAGRQGTWAAGAFLLLAVLQSQDLLIANRVLGPGQAGRFAVLSTLGGIAAFATVTIPLVLLPRAAARERHALGAALGLAAVVGGMTVGVAAVAAPELVTALFGHRYTTEVAPLAVLYLGAMGLLGLARVLVANRCATGRPRVATLALAGACAAQGLLIVEGPPTPSRVAHSTLWATAGVTVALGGLELARRARLSEWWARVRAALGAAAASPAVRVVAAATVVGATVRVVVPRGLWIDEATSVFQARMGFGAMLVNLRATDVHPPLYFAVLWEVVRALGSGEAAVRVPSMVAGVALIPMLYLLGKEAYDRRTGVVAAILGTVAPFLVWYSQEVRMYSLFSLLAVVALWAQVRAVRRGRVWEWTVYALASAAMVWTQYFGVLQVVVQQVAFAGFVWRRRRAGERVAPLFTGWLLSGAVIAAALAPLLPFAAHQFQVNQAAGKGFGAGPSQVGGAVSNVGQQMSIYSLLANTVWAVLGYHSDRAMAAIVALWPVGMLGAVFLLGRRRQPTTTLLAAACVLPVLALFGLGEVKRDMFDARYFSGAVAVSVVLLARLVTTARRRSALTVGCLAMVGLLASALFDEQTNGSNPRRFSFREAMQVLNTHGRTGDRVYYSPGDLGTVVGYYDRGRYTIAPLNPDPARDTASGTIFVLASPRLMSRHADQVAGNVLVAIRRHHRQVRKIDFDNVTLWEFS